MSFLVTLHGCDYTDHVVSVVIVNFSLVQSNQILYGCSLGGPLPSWLSGAATLIFLDLWVNLCPV